MTRLCGKGIWLTHSHDFDRAVEMTTRIGGTHLFVKTGHGPIYFPETTRDMVQRIRSIGLKALAWVQLTADTSREGRRAIAESFDRGYEAVVLVVPPGGLPSQDGKAAASLRDLTEALIDVETPVERLFLASPPLSALPDPGPVEALVSVCQGGWMPLCFAAQSDDALQVIEQEVYHQLDALSMIWGKTPEVYPVLAQRHSSKVGAMLPEEFIPWIEGIARHGVNFFSVYAVVDTERALWPMLQAVNVACMETDGRNPVQDRVMSVSTSAGVTTVAQPVYITVKTSDTVWGIIARHGLKREQFWTWNGHLWDSRGLPRDPDYLQEGWRLRVK